MRLREEQRAIIASYRGGKLAISAVPGSGKTQTLAALAVHLLTRGLVGPDSEVLVVTFTNSAVENVRTRIRQALSAPAGGFRVLTLHSLANTIVQECPDLAGVAYDYQVDDELSSTQALIEASEWVIQRAEAQWQGLIADGLTPQQRAEAEAQWRDDTIPPGRGGDPDGEEPLSDARGGSRARQCRRIALPAGWRSDLRALRPGNAGHRPAGL
jgi:DNA helicase-2/ATP-dependent DNA helicase PcrA